MIDTHCHLTDPRLFEQLDGVLSRAAAAGVTEMVTIGTGLEDACAAIELCKSHAQVRCAVGIHPNYTANAGVEDVALLRGLQSNPAVVALGEMGLDYHHDRAAPAHQRQMFEAQLQLATELNRPVIIHCREAVDDTLTVMRSFPQVRAVFHCFTGSADEALRILAAGYLLGFTGVVTFKKNDDLRAIVRATPLDRMLVETDAPYLAPQQMRAKTNEPSYVMYTAATIAQVKGVDIAKLDRITTENAKRFYQW